MIRVHATSGASNLFDDRDAALAWLDAVGGGHLEGEAGPRGEDELARGVAQEEEHALTDDPAMFTGHGPGCSLCNPVTHSIIATEGIDMTETTEART